jgi:hypothetical protein
MLRYYLQEDIIGIGSKSIGAISIFFPYSITKERPQSNPSFNLICGRLLSFNAGFMHSLTIERILFAQFKAFSQAFFLSNSAGNIPITESPTYFRTYPPCPMISSRDSCEKICTIVANLTGGSLLAFLLYSRLGSSQH